MVYLARRGPTHSLASLVTFEGGGPIKVSAASTSATTAASSPTEDSTSHLIGSLASLLGKDNLELPALHDEAVHLLASVEGLLMGGILDEGKALWLLGVKVAGDVDITDVTDTAKGLVNIGCGDVVGNVAHEEGNSRRALATSSTAAPSTATATRRRTTIFATIS